MQFNIPELEIGDNKGFSLRMQLLCPPGLTPPIRPLKLYNFTYINSLKADDCSDTNRFLEAKCVFLYVQLRSPRGLNTIELEVSLLFGHSEGYGSPFH